MKANFLAECFAGFGLFLATQSAATAVLYQVIDLGAVNGSTHIEARGITQDSDVWGENFNTAYPYFLWKNGTNRGIAKPDEASAMSLYGMNDAGQFAGSCSFSTSTRNFAFVGSPYWPIPIATNFLPRAVNIHGVVAGVTSIKVELYSGGPLTTVNRPAFAVGQKLTILPSLIGSNVWNNAEATAINDSGHIVGWSHTSTLGSASNYTHAFLWDGAMHDLHTLTIRTNSYAVAVNNNDMIVGYQKDGAFTANEPFYWTAASNMVALAVPGGYSSAQPLGLNNRGDIVGVADSSAVLWTNGVMTDLQTVIPPSPSWDLDGANGINDKLEICGYGKNGGLTKGFLLRSTNVPPAQLTVELLDPGDPSLTNVITSFQIATNRAVLNAMTTVRRGIAADGASRLILRASTTNHGTVAFSLRPADGATGLSSYDEQNGGVGNIPHPGGLPFSLSRYDEPTEDTPEGIRAYAVYYAPEQYHRTGSNDSAEIHRIIKLQAIFTPNSGSTVTQSVPIIIARPPLITLHGLWSDASQSFGGFISSFRKLEAGAQIFAPSYSNAASFAANRSVVPREIANACAAYREQNLAAARADIYAHSMGGVLSRIHAGRADYKRPDNYLHGDINRLVTIDSPHRGSFIADGIDNMFTWLTQNDLEGARLTIDTAMVFFKMPPDQGAGHDLMSTSAEIVKMNQQPTDVAAHVIVGDFTNHLDLTAMPSPYGTLFNVLNWYAPPGVHLNDLFFPPLADSDLVVSRDSQAAGLDGTSACSVFNMIHVGAANDTNAINQCWLLYLTVPPHLWWSTGFPTGWTPSPQPPAPPPPPMTTSSNAPSYLVLLASSVNSGASTSASVNEPSGVMFSSVLLATRDVALADTNAPFDFTFTVPASAVGDYPVSYFATDSASNLWSGTKMISVTPLASLNYLEAAPRRFLFNRLGDSEQIIVTGVYPDIGRNVTDPSTGITFSSANTNVVYVSSNGVMTAQSNGETQIIASLGGKTAYVNAVVSATAEPDLTLALAASATNVLAGEMVTFTLAVTNVGSQTASGVYLEFKLPTDAQLQSASVSQGIWSFTNGTFAAGLEALASGSNALATIAVTFASGGAHVGIGTAASIGLDSNETDNNVAVTVNVTVRPALGIRMNGTDVTVFWPTNASGFTLESTTALVPTPVWITATTNPVVVGDLLEFSLPPTNTARYFRLRSP